MDFVAGIDVGGGKKGFHLCLMNTASLEIIAFYHLFHETDGLTDFLYFTINMHLPKRAVNNNLFFWILQYSFYEILSFIRINNIFIPSVFYDFPFWIFINKSLD